MRPDRLVVLACFGASPSTDALLGRVRLHASVVRIDDRTHVSNELHSLRPAFVLFPLNDHGGVTTLPVVERVVGQAPDLAVIVCIAPGGSTHGLARALQLRTRLLAWTTEGELARGVDALFAAARFSADDAGALESVLSSVSPPSMVAPLVRCAALAHRRLKVGTLAQELGMSRRTLNRAAQRSGWLAPAELIAWGRLLRASTMRWRGEANVASVARLSGYTSADRLLLELRQLGGGGSAEDLVPLRIAIALQRRTEQMSTESRARDSSVR
jgi:AraC-like DNA-binding protein